MPMSVSAAAVFRLSRVLKRCCCADGSLAAIGYDQMAASQLTGQPGNAPSISMLDWTNGEGSAWYW